MKFWLGRAGSILLALAACACLQLVITTQSGSVQRLVTLAGLYVTLAVSLNLINGITGQFSMGHAAFYQIGAYTAGFIAMRFYAGAKLPPELWMILSMLIAAVFASIAGLVVGLPSLRLKGDYLAIVTLGFGEIIRIVVQNQPVLGDAYGLSVAPNFKMTWLVWLLAILCIAVCRNLIKTAHGLQFLAVREDEVASSAMGVNVTRTKVTAFVIGSAFAGAAGALLAHVEGFISPDTFSMDVSFTIVTMVVLGGTGSITGATLAAIGLFFLPEKMRDLPDFPLGNLVASGVGIVIMVVGFRHIAAHFHGKVVDRVMRYLAILTLAVVVALILGPIVSKIPTLGVAVDGDKLRMVVFAVTLIVLMLLRPQGIFAHHEFSWAWLQSAIRACWGWLCKFVRIGSQKRGKA